MGEVRFMISEAAKQVHVESHVLRYWEEELELVIGRTEMGHRYYTEDDIQLFCCIKKLKDAGMLLKDLKPLIPELKSTKLKLQKTEALKKAALKKEMTASTVSAPLRFLLRRLYQLQQPSPKQKSCRSLNWNRSVL